MAYMKEQEQQASTMQKAVIIAVECMECGKRFSTASLIPTCPKCGGSDVDLAGRVLPLSLLDDAS